MVYRSTLSEMRNVKKDFTLKKKTKQIKTGKNTFLAHNGDRSVPVDLTLIERVNILIIYRIPDSLLNLINDHDFNF